MKCEVCGKGPVDGVTVYRTGMKGPGQDPHWRCEVDIPMNQAADPEVVQVVAIFENDVNKIKH